MFDREQVFLQLLDDGTIDVYAVPFSYAMGIAGISGMSSYGSARYVPLSVASCPLSLVGVLTLLSLLCVGC